MCYSANAFNQIRLYGLYENYLGPRVAKHNILFFSFFKDGPLQRYCIYFFGTFLLKITTASLSISQSEYYI